MKYMKHQGALRGGIGDELEVSESSHLSSDQEILDFHINNRRGTSSISSNGKI